MLSLNVKKSNYMIFKSREKMQNTDLSVTLNNHKIDRVMETVFVSVILDEHLSWKPHISYVATILAKMLMLIQIVHISVLQMICSFVSL